jgi:hypothetical protein
VDEVPSTEPAPIDYFVILSPVYGTSPGADSAVTYHGDLRTGVIATLRHELLGFGGMELSSDGLRYARWLPAMPSRTASGPPSEIDLRIGRHHLEREAFQGGEAA